MSIPALIPIRTVCAMYGLNANTLRTWERRYGFVSPQRGEGGHRGYAPEDVQVIERMVKLLAQGMTPADAAERARRIGARPHAAPESGEADKYVAELKAEIDRFDEPAARNVTRAAIRDLGYAGFVEGVAFPVLDQLGHAWEMNQFGVAVEHFATLLVESLLREKGLRFSVPEDAPVLVLACVPEELHHLPILHLANLVGERKLARTVVLASGLPMEEILDACRRTNAKVLLLSATLSPTAVRIREWLDACVAAGWSDRLLLAGPGFMRSRIYVHYNVRTAAGGFARVTAMIEGLLKGAAAIEHDTL